MIFLDTNVLIDVIAPGQAWREWSRERLRTLGVDQAFVINQVVVAELASGFPTLGTMQSWLSRFGAQVRMLDASIAFDCGMAFRTYRDAHKERSAILSDFLIGGHARHLGASLLTRDTAIYRRYFPDLTLITPDTHP